MEKRLSYRALRGIKWLIVVGVFALLIVAVTRIVLHQLRPVQMVSLGGSVFRAEIVDEPETRARGLSGRTTLGADEAMLFVFEADGSLPIWMKGMKFPIDIVWLDQDRRIVHIERHVQPDAEPYHTYESPAPARYVLEVAAGQADVSIGAVATFDVASEGL